MKTKDYKEILDYKKGSIRFLTGTYIWELGMEIKFKDMEFIPFVSKICSIVANSKKDFNMGQEYC